MKQFHKPVIRSTRRVSCSLRGTRAFWVALCLACSITPGPAFAINDAYLPFVESLQTVQQRAYAQAAPSGHDQPLADLAELPEDTGSIQVEREESRLEQLADEKSGPLSLQDKQQDQVLHADLEQFGYDIFGRVPSTFSPVAGIPVPPNYRIGPGDTIIVQLFGKRNVEYKLVVTRDGNILVPEYGPVTLAGMTFDEAEQVLTKGFESQVIGVKAVVTMGQLRTIQIRLAGDVVQPGVYTIGGLSTMIDALLVTGGVRPTGSLRNIELVRGGKTVAKLDLYDLLLRGRMDQDFFLQHNDTIFVPAIGPIVYVGGEVQRPAIYESPIAMLDDTQPVRVMSPRSSCWLWLIVGGSLLVMMMSAVFVLLVDSDPAVAESNAVTVNIKTQSGSYTVDTEARTVAELLEAEGILLNDDSLISPDPSTPLKVNMLIEISEAQTVALTIDGQTQIIHTRQTRPVDVLDEAGIDIGAADRVFLDGQPIDNDALPNITRPALNIVIQRGFLLTIIDDGIETQLASQGPTVGDALFEADIQLFLADAMTPDLGTPLAQGMTITITRSRPLSIIVDGERIETRTGAETVGEAIFEAGIVLSGLDYTAPAVDMPIVANTSVRVIRVTEELTTEQELIEYSTLYQADAELALDSRRILQAGQNGIIRRAIRVRYENGIEIERMVETEEQIQAVQDEVVGYGTNVVIRTVNTPDGPVEYWRKLRVYATSYHPEALGGDDVTATGMQLRTGVVAIDPDIVSYRTQVYVDGYGTGIAADTGAHRRNPYWVDLGYSDDEYKGWHWWVDMYLLTPVPANINYLLPLRAEGGPVP